MLKIAAGQQSFLNVLVKVNTTRLTTEVTDPKAYKRPINKLLIARLKDTSLLFSFFVSVSVIN